MTNTELQMVGIDEAAFNAASEERRIEWGKSNTTAGCGLCESARVWLGKTQSVEWKGLGDWVVAEEFCPLDDGFIYRLAPDYQPPVKRWWFDTNLKNVFQSTEDHTSPAIEVTADYAAYLQVKPEEECELRLPQKGNEFLAFMNLCQEWVEADCDSEDNSKLYRWCKPRKVLVCRYGSLKQAHVVEIPYAEAKKWGLA